MKQFKTLKGKLIFTGVAILLPTVLINLWISAVLSYRGMEKNVKKDLKSVGQTAQVAFINSTNLMKEKIQFVASLRTISGFSAGDENWVNNNWVAYSLNRIKGTYGYKSLYFADQTGKITSMDTDYSGKNVANTEYFEQAMKGKTVLSVPIRDVAGNLAVISAAPVSDEKYKGVVIGETDAQTYSKILSTNVVIGQTGNVFVLDKSGVMIANKRPQLVEQKQNFIEMAKKDGAYATSAKVYKKMISGQSGIDTYSYENGTRICYYQTIAGTDGWSCGVVAPLSEMMSEAYPVIIGMIAASSVLLILGVILMSRLAKSVSAPIRSCSERLLLLAEGDLHSPIPLIHASDETGDLAKATSVLTGNLKEIVGDVTALLTALAGGDFRVSSKCSKYWGDLKPIRVSIDKILNSLNIAFSQISRSAEQVAVGSGQVADASQQLAQGAEEQSASVDTLSQSIKSLSSDIQSSTQNADCSSNRAGIAVNELMDGSCKIKEMMAAMDQIRDSSQKIGQITKSAKKIAFQTNILALNAAVEAARAGKSGKSFSVVAEAIRDLAAQSAQASRETEELIDGLIQSVNRGTVIADQTGKTASSMIEDTKAILADADAISGTARKQSDSIQEITESVEQISSVIQTNSSTAEESAASSEELSSLAAALRKLVRQFRLRDQAQR